MSRKSEASVYDESDYEEVTVQEATNGYEIDSDVEMGTRKRGTRQAKYPFDALEVGQSFHVAATEEMPKPGITLAGAVSNANNKWSHEDPSGATEVKTLSVFQKDEDGKRVKDEDGKYIKIGEQEVTVPVRIEDRHFVISTVDNTDKRGAGARVFRTL